jgi:hypothetical protein
MGAFPLIHLHPYAIERFLCTEIIREDFDTLRIYDFSLFDSYIDRSQQTYEQRSCHPPHKHKR